MITNLISMGIAKEAAEIEVAGQDEEEDEDMLGARARIVHSLH